MDNYVIIRIVLCFLSVILCAHPVNAEKVDTDISDLQPLKDYSGDILNVSASTQAELIEETETGTGNETKTKVRDRVGSSNDVVVSGKFVYYDSVTGSYEPVRFARVELWDFDQFGGNELLAFSATDSDGKYSFEPVVNIDVDELNGKIDVFVVIYAESASSVITDPNLRIWSSVTQLSLNVPNGEIDMGIYKVNNPTPFGIMDIIHDGFGLVLRHGYHAPGVYVVYPAPLSCYFSSNDLIYIQSDQEEYLEYYVLHEYGHFISDQVSYMPPTGRIDYPPGGPGPYEHTLISYETPVDALEEGWACFFQTVVEYEYNYPNKKAFAEVLEEFSDYLPYLDESKIDSVAGAVAGTFWDIYDEGDDNEGENLQLGFDEIFDVFRNLNKEDTVDDETHTIYEFWDVWIERGHGHEAELANVFTLNGLDKVHDIDISDDQPIQPDQPEPECRLVTQDGEWLGKTDKLVVSLSNIRDFRHIEYKCSDKRDFSDYYMIQDPTCGDGICEYRGSLNLYSAYSLFIGVDVRLNSGNEISCLSDSGKDVIQVDIDMEYPSGSIEIADGDVTESADVKLELTFNDELSGIGECRYRNEDSDWTDWEKCAETKDWTLTEGKGTKTVYYQIRDVAGNVYECSDTIEFRPVITVCSDGCNYEDISEAIKNAEEGDTITVIGGVYHEELVIDKKIAIKGKEVDGARPVIDAADTAVTITADGVEFDHFTVKSQGVGIVVFSSDNILRGNKITENKYGIFIRNGINNEISHNEIFKNDFFGLLIYFSDSNQLLSNDIYENGYYGLYFYNSDSNTITGSKIFKNNYYGIVLCYSDSNKFCTNTVSQHRIDILQYRSQKNTFLYTSGTMIKY